MILKLSDIQDICSKLLFSVDSTNSFIVNETLELYTEGSLLYLSVTNREYFVKINIKLTKEENFHATVNASVFLKLISQLTTDTVELTTEDTTLIIKGNGIYKLPMIYDNDTLLKLPEIVINNKTASFNINSSILSNILNYNSKELNKDIIFNPVQKLYYIDEKGCITFTSGACVTSFRLEAPIKILLSNKIVKLFKLFTSETVKFTLGQDSAGSIIQTKVRFESDNIELSAILNNDESLLNSVPVDAIRARATDVYNYSVVIDKDEMLQLINRLLLFSNSKEILKPFSMFEFSNSNITIWDRKKENKEVIFYNNSISIKDEKYSAIIDLNDIKLTLEGCKEKYITMNFGNSQAIVIQRPNVYNIIPEIVED